MESVPKGSQPPYRAGLSMRSHAPHLDPSAENAVNLNVINFVLKCASWIQHSRQTCEVTLFPEENSHKLNTLLPMYMTLTCMTVTVLFICV